jgi:hypothetical protein
MASGQQSGEFSLKIVSMTFTPGPAQSVLLAANCEGTATGFGQVPLTATFVTGKSGTYSLCGVAYMDNGDILPFSGEGTHESSGLHKWRTQGVNHLPDGRRLGVEGAIDLATRTWSGQFSEKS